MAVEHDTSSSTAARIPVELLRQIILELADTHGQQTLRPCVKVSRAWRGTALPVFLRRVEIICDLRTDRLSLLRDWLATHHDMAQHIKTLEITGHLRLVRETWAKPHHIDINLDVMRDVLSSLSSLAELRLLHVAITRPPTLTRHKPPVPIRSLILKTAGPEYDDDDFEQGHCHWYGLPMFSALSAVLSVTAPDTVILKGGYKRTSRDPPDDVPAPQLVNIRSLNLGKHWLNPEYLRILLAPDTLEHFAMAWPWRERSLASQLPALIEYAGRSLKSIDVYLDKAVNFTFGE